MLATVLTVDEEEEQKEHAYLEHDAGIGHQTGAFRCGGLPNLSARDCKL